GDPVALVERDHAGPLDRRDVNEGVRLTVVAGDEAEALRRVEELDRARGLLAGQLALRAALARGALLDRKRIALDLEVGRGDAAATVHQGRSEEHTSELQSQSNLVCRLLLEKKKTKTNDRHTTP